MPTFSNHWHVKQPFLIAVVLLGINLAGSGQLEKMLIFPEPDGIFDYLYNFLKELLAIRRLFSLVDMITKTKFSNCPNVFFLKLV